MNLGSPETPRNSGRGEAAPRNSDAARGAQSPARGTKPAPPRGPAGCGGDRGSTGLLERRAAPSPLADPPRAAERSDPSRWAARGSAGRASRGTPDEGAGSLPTAAAPYCLDTTATTGGIFPAAAPPERRPRSPELAAALAEDPELGRRNYHKRHAVRMARALYRAELGKLAARVAACGQTLALDERGAVVGRERCNVRGCPICQAARSLRWAWRLRGGLALAAAELPVSFAHLTLTVRNCAPNELRARLTDVHDSLHRFTKRSAFSPAGWVRNTEVTVNKVTGEVHPHVHMLLALPLWYWERRLGKERPPGAGRPRIVPGYMTHAEYVALWRECARLDYAPSVRIRGVKIDTPEGKRALYEVSKYGVKPSSLLGIDPAALRTITAEIAGTRSIAVGGDLRRFLREPDEDGEPETDTVVAAVATWDGHRYRTCDPHA